MARTKRLKGRYSMDAVRFEIARMRDDLGMQDKDVYLAIGMGQTTFSRKMSGARDFDLSELAQIADFFSETTGRSLPGWPFLSSQECLAIERSMPAIYGKAPQGSHSTR